MLRNLIIKKTIGFYSYKMSLENGNYARTFSGVLWFSTNFQ